MSIKPNSKLIAESRERLLRNKPELSNMQSGEGPKQVKFCLVSCLDHIEGMAALHEERAAR
ncbi:MAG: hypothetical protein JKY93_01850 [Gammaproteobacteria bacterium]|nr:hypothetical protein [Gammaproteobacteria bacterium]